MKWDTPDVPRDQLLLFSRSLDDAVPQDHLVRVVDDILCELDWSAFECQYDDQLGQPAIHPRVVAGVILYGHLTRVRTSRQLEAALTVRFDFLWLVEGRTIDHSTISRFRRKFGSELIGIGAQMAVMAHQLGLTTLTQIGFDGTRLRASNGRNRSVKVEQLDQLEQTFHRKLQELEQQAQAEDTRDEERLVTESTQRVRKELADARNRLAAIRKAKEEIQRAREADEAVPNRVPLTDPQSRITKNKDGGFAPNFTPTAAVDMESGLILDADVIADTDEEKCLLPSLERIESTLGEYRPDMHVERATVDGRLVTGPNLKALADRHTELCGPIAPRPDFVDRPDGRCPIPPERWDELPTRVAQKAKGAQPAQVQLTKEAFLYDAQKQCYWCPTGQKLSFVGKTSEDTVRKGASRRVERRRYVADVTSCTSCPLKSRCVTGSSGRRTLSDDQYEEHREALRQRMLLAENTARLKSRQTDGERPFAVIKHHFGIRQLLLRGLASAQTEWRWITTSVNLKLLAGYRTSVVDARLPGARGSPELAGA